MNYKQTFNMELNENLQALELLQNYGNTSQYLDVIHDIMNIHHMLHSFSFDRDEAAELVGSVYVKNFEFYKDIRSIPGVISLPFAKAPDHILISNLALQLCYLKNQLQQMTQNSGTDMLTTHTCSLLLDMIETAPYAS